MKNGLNLGTETVKTTTQVRYPGSDPDLRSCGKLDHLSRLSRTERSNNGSAPLSTLIVARPGSSM